MTYFAKVENGIVTQVIVADQNVIDSGLFGDPSIWFQTDYYTYGGVHYGVDGKPDGGAQFRMNYAGIHFAYDAALDAFIPPKPYPSWLLNTTSCLWIAPIPYQNDGKYYVWNETTQMWDVID